jgi:hypothetical protein
MIEKAIAAALLATLPAAASAQPIAQQRPALLNSLAACRALAEAAARLACFDRAAAAIDEAEKRKDLVVVDRDQLRKTRRTLFGLTLPNLSVFGDDSPDEDGVQRIETTIKNLTQNGLGKWVFTLADQAGVWEQTDSRNLAIDPRPGHRIKIRRAALGSYLANVQDQTAIRVRRLR